MPLYLTEDEVAGLLAPPEAFAAVEAAFMRLAAGEVATAPRERLELPDGQFALMACADRGLGFAGLKTYLWTPAATPFLVVLLSLEPARVEAVLEADMLGRLRTAAASAVAATRLARKAPSTLGVFGCGRQAASHVRALRDALPSLDRVLAHCRDGGRLAEFCDAHGCEAAASH